MRKRVQSKATVVMMMSSYKLAEQRRGQAESLAQPFGGAGCLDS